MGKIQLLPFLCADFLSHFREWNKQLWGHKSFSSNLRFLPPKSVSYQTQEERDREPQQDRGSEQLEDLWMEILYKSLIWSSHFFVTTYHRTTIGQSQTAKHCSPEKLMRETADAFQNQHNDPRSHSGQVKMKHSRCLTCSYFILPNLLSFKQPCSPFPNSFQRTGLRSVFRHTNTDTHTHIHTLAALVSISPKDHQSNVMKLGEWCGGLQEFPLNTVQPCLARVWLLHSSVYTPSSLSFSSLHPSWAYILTICLALPLHLSLSPSHTLCFWDCCCCDLNWEKSKWARVRECVFVRACLFGLACLFDTEWCRVVYSFITATGLWRLFPPQ